MPAFLRPLKASVLVTDLDPLAIKKRWQKQVAARLTIDVYQVDAHNIVPCWLASAKQEFAARTFRPKVERLLFRFLGDFPVLRRHPCGQAGRQKPTDWHKARAFLRVDRQVPAVAWLEPGEKGAQKVLKDFIVRKLARYDQGRNDPLQEATSDLSPHLHFGQLSAQRVALAVQAAAVSPAAQAAFLEELIVRRELSDNFCFYNEDYDSFSGLPNWAKQTLQEHVRDRRSYLYSRAKFESGQTHDPLWNAAQRQMVRTGKMHGYLRMYWAKKILEWSKNPAEAIKTAVYLNDKYSLDGRDPNGYVGILWSIGGLHDRPWGERPVFGKVRYMSYNGAKSKFDVGAFAARWPKETEK